ncbi:MAG: hypothetical protein ABI882_20830 [Acidobacteriota bacterium]
MMSRTLAWAKAKAILKVRPVCPREVSMGGQHVERSARPGEPFAGTPYRALFERRIVLGLASRPLVEV